MRLSAFELACIRGGHQVFAGLEFSVKGGEALLILGPNGAGKSSLLRLIAGFLRASSGRLSLEEGDPQLSIAEQAHYLGHQDALKPSLTVWENLAFWTDTLAGSRSAATAALSSLALDRITGIPAAYLSAGQRRRLSIARLMAVYRPIWLLDEPTSSLDRAGQATLVGLMRQHLASGGLILAATHDPVAIDGARELRLGDSP
jgi:heme exporter protein A